MTDHRGCDSHLHSHSHQPLTNIDEIKSSSADLKATSVTVDDIHRHFTLNENDTKSDESHTVSQLFDMAWSNQNHLQSPSANTTTDEYASKLLHTIRLLESIEKRLASLELFSDNEYIDEVSTTNLRYLLLNAFLGWLFQTKRSKPSQRLTNVQHACDYYSKFLTITRNYGLHKHSIPRAPTNDNCEKTEHLSSRDVDMIKMAQDRASKIRG